jgi:ceramide glucosyltransferase
MNLEALLGNNWITVTLFAAAAAMVCADFLATLFSVVYQRYWYDRALRPRYDTNFAPSCAIIVPCKGEIKNVEENLRSFLHLDYPAPYRVVFVVEDDADLAATTIRDVIEGASNARMVVAGLASNCAQKNHNLLAAVRTVQDADVYVFADADIGPKPRWLRELVLPLSDSKVVVTTGFRWLSISRPGLGAMVHNSINILLYVLLSVASFAAEVGLWGGSMAIRRKDFEELGVADLWGATVVDDISLSSRVASSGRSAVMVPTCVTSTDDFIGTVAGGVRWFERQIMFLKAYHHGLWMVGGGALVLLGMALTFWAPLAALLSISPRYSFLDMGGAASLLYLVGQVMTALLLYPLLGELHRVGPFAALQPFMRTTQMVSYVRTVFTNVVTWSGVRYHLDRKGVVTRVERTGQ